MVFESISRSPTDQVSIGGLYLQHYLTTLENLQKTFQTQDLNTFNLYVSYIRAIITDQTKKKKIDQAMDKRREEMITENKRRKDRGFDLFSNKMIEFMVGFCAIEACMEHLDYTLKISRTDVTILADQDDEEMPQPVAEKE